MSAPTALPVLVFDGDCGFCTTCARFLVHRVVRDGHSSVAPWQRLDLDELGLTASQCQSAVQWVDKSRGVVSGHLAIAAALRTGNPVWRPVGTLLASPGFSWLAGQVYAWVASHRYALPGGTPACRVDRTNSTDPNQPR